MSKWKRIIGVLVAIFAISARPLLNHLLWLQKAPPDEKVGVIPILSNKDLSSLVSGKNALLIGGTRGVGFGTAQALAKAGAHVTIVGRSKDSGERAVSKIQDVCGASGSVVDFVQGDIGTVCSALELVDRLASRDRRYDLAVVSAGIFPDWTRPLQNEDGIDKSIAITVVGRFLVYRNMHRFMNDGARILNVLNSGDKLPPSAGLFDRDIIEGKRDVTSLIEAGMNFGIGEEIMMDSLFRYDESYTNRKFTMVSTHPGILDTDLLNGQGVLVDILFKITVPLVGISVEDCGVLQSSILVSEKLHQFGLTLVDHFGYGRIRDPAFADLIEQHRDWLW
eukprot:CAMPEP_0172495220 /NCGR_PEP_ID=MMETSP1066-20121228/64711_1 /TAXON_ID=671091 /ORGANISM="Coscinodiscus wailesii, Strain CCMP2513" /LENGTH=335 /DNA_ID=CAMNT_0013266745 /DNA_START=36 /DNA_END=1040 /DNA_ORIENTATION=-